MKKSAQHGARREVELRDYKEESAASIPSDMEIAPEPISGGEDAPPKVQVPKTSLSEILGSKKINCYDVVVMDELREKYPEKFTETGAMDHVWFEKDIRPHHFIYVRNDKNSIAFTIQDGPVKEVGLNGCQAVELIQAARQMIEFYDKKYPARENVKTLRALDEALKHQEDRKKERERRDVEGTSAK